MKKYLLVIVIMASGLMNLVQARIRGNIPATYIENRELIFRHTRMNSKKNPLQIQIVASDVNGNELTIALPVQIGRGGEKAITKIPTVANDTRVSFEVWGGKFSKENRFKHTMIIFNDPNLQLADVLDDENETISIPDQFSPDGLIGKEGPMGPQGASGSPGPIGPRGPAGSNTSIDNDNQSLAMSGAVGSNVTLVAQNSGDMNLTLPSSGGTIATLNGPTPMAIDPSSKDIEGGDTIDATDLNYVTIDDTNNTSTDTLQYITGGTKGQQLIIELKEDINFYADNQDTPNTIQWGRGTGVGAVLPGSAREIFRFIHNGTAWFLVDRFTL